MIKTEAHTLREMPSTFAIREAAVHPTRPRPSALWTKQPLLPSCHQKTRFSLNAEEEGVARDLPVSPQWVGYFLNSLENMAETNQVVYCVDPTLLTHPNSPPTKKAGMLAVQEGLSTSLHS